MPDSRKSTAPPADPETASTGQAVASPNTHTSGDIVIVGAGLAGLFTALKLAPLPVTVVAAAPLGTGAASAWAQGGIAAAVGPGDSIEAHTNDTIKAGAGIVDEQIARATAQAAPACIEDLVAYGVPFDHDDQNQYLLSKEAAHSKARVVRIAGDRAGHGIMQALIAATRRTASIRLLAGYEATALTKDNAGNIDGVTLAATNLENTLGSKKESHFQLPASAVVLATGGIGALYAVTTNPLYARGDAIGMAARIGALITDAEFVQFHPTAIDAGLDPAPLATEALRGEGAVLINAAGTRFMLSQHDDAELAPRDIVARAVFAELTAERGAFLDCRDAIGADLPSRFPTVFAHCQQAGIDPVKQPIPVAPAEHYHMGGIATDARGRTSINGLWACGEVTSTGLHGANRLASNSLAEAVVFGTWVARDIAKSIGQAERGELAMIELQDREHRLDKPPLKSIQTTSFSAIGPSLDRSEAITLLRQTMQTHVGVVRDGIGLAKAVRMIAQLERDWRHDRELANMTLAARFIATAALLREESRGGHYRSDFPSADPAKAHRCSLSLKELDTALADLPDAPNP